MTEERCYRTGEHAANRTADDDLDQTLYTDQQHDEHQRVGRAERGNALLNVVGLVEHQNNVTHEENGIQQRMLKR